MPQNPKLYDLIICTGLIFIFLDAITSYGIIITGGQELNPFMNSLLMETGLIPAYTANILLSLLIIFLLAKISKKYLPNPYCYVPLLLFVLAKALSFGYNLPNLLMH